MSADTANTGAFGTDGGTPKAHTAEDAGGVAPTDLGALVVDTDADEPNVGVVTNRPPVACEEWTVYRDGDDAVTVADDNPGYDPEADVVVVVFRDDLREAHPDFAGENPLPVAETARKTYAFPPGRLEAVGRLDSPVGHVPPEERLTDAQRDLRDRLGERSDVEVVDGGGDVALLQLEKLGDTYTIYPSGRVEGDGTIAERLAGLAAEYLGGEDE